MTTCRRHHCNKIWQNDPSPLSFAHRPLNNRSNGLAAARAAACTDTNYRVELVSADSGVALRVAVRTFANTCVTRNQGRRHGVFKGIHTPKKSSSQLLDSDRMTLHWMCLCLIYIGQGPCSWMCMVIGRCIIVYTIVCIALMYFIFCILYARLAPKLKDSLLT